MTSPVVDLEDVVIVAVVEDVISQGDACSGPIKLDTI
jgi:hypothetical protein